MSVCSDNKFFFSHGYTGMREWLRMDYTQMRVRESVFNLRISVAKEYQDAEIGE